VSTISYNVEADGVDGRESTSIVVDGKSPSKIGKGGRERIEIVFGDDVA
jgi:hypothetical protein